MLPTGYQKVTDPSTGKPYYVNLVTGQSSWNPPAGVAATPKATVPTSSVALDPGWEERVDPQTGRTFYIDHINKRTTWDDPRQANLSQPSYPEPTVARQNTPRRTAQFDSDAELARELAAQWRSEDEQASDVAAASNAGEIEGGNDQKDWATDAETSHCFLTGVKFTMVNRKHHCRYCGQIFVSDVCKKMTKIPSLGFNEPVRVCDICHDQLERGDPVCISKQVALMRAQSESSRQQGSKALASWASMDPQFATSTVQTALEALKMTELLDQLLKSGNAATQAAAAQLMSAMLNHDEYREMLVDGGLVEPLLSVVRSSNSEAKSNAVGAISSLTVVESGRHQVRAAGGLGVLLDVLLSTTVEAVQDATCQVLANMCEDQTDDWRQLLQSGAVFPLVSMMSSTNTSLQENALTLLAMLGSHTECCDQLADSGSMPSLAVLLGSNKAEVQRAALALAQQLCGSSRRACDAMLEAGSAAPLAAMLLSSSNGNTEVIAAVLECLLHLTNSGLTQAQIAVRNVGAVPHLIQLMNHESQRISEVAASLVSSLCPGDMQNAEQLFESGGLVMLAEHLNSREERAQLQAVSALSQLSSDPLQAKAIVENGCLNPLLELLEHPNQELKSYAAIAFGNLCNSNSIPAGQLQHPSVLPHLVAMLSSSNGLAKGPAAAAIASMASQPHLRQSLYELGGLPGLTALLQTDVETSYHAVQAVAQFAADERYRALLPEVGAMPPLTALLTSAQPHVQQCALSAIANTSFVPSSVESLCSSGALAQVGQLLFSKDEGVQKMCLTTLCNLLNTGASSADRLLQVGGHMALLTQLSSPNPDSQSQAAMAIGHLSRHKPAVQALLQVDIVQVLAQLLHSPHPSVQLQAVYAVGVLSAEDEAAASAVQKAGLVAPLTTLLLSGGAIDVKQHLTLTLAHIVRGNWRPVFNVGGFQALLDVLAVGTDPVQQDVSASLAILLEDVHQRRALLADMNSVSAIVGLLSSKSEVTQRNASAALAALSDEAAAREVLYRLGTLSHIIRSLTATNMRQDESGADTAKVSMLRVVAAFAADARYCNMLRITIQPLVAMLTSGHASVLAHAANAVTSLSSSESNRDALRDAGALGRMAELLLHADESVQQSAVQCVANLGVDASEAQTFMTAGWHLSLISLLSASSTDVQGAAAVVLGNLSSVPAFREALMADGALQPILQLLHAAALPTKTAAIRALAIMSQQVMAASLPPDDPSCSQFVEAFFSFDGAALAQLLDVLDAQPPPPTEPTAATSERQIVAVLLLLQNLSGGHGQVRPRLVEGGTIAPLVRFLVQRSSSTVASDAEMRDSAASTLANLVLTSEGPSQLAQAGGMPVLLTLLRSGRADLVAPVSRTVGYLARDSLSCAIAESALPVLLPLLGKAKAAALPDLLFSVGNIFCLQRDAFAGGTLVQLASGLVQSVNEAHGDDVCQAVLALASQVAVRADGRHALRNAGLEAALRKAAPLGRGVNLLLGILSAQTVTAERVPPSDAHAQASPPQQTLSISPPPQHTPAMPPPPQQTPNQPPPQVFVPPLQHTPAALPPPQHTPLVPPSHQHMAAAPPPLQQVPTDPPSPRVFSPPPSHQMSSTQHAPAGPLPPQQSPLAAAPPQHTPAMHPPPPQMLADPPPSHMFAPSLQHSPAIPPTPPQQVPPPPQQMPAEAPPPHILAPPSQQVPAAPPPQVFAAPAQAEIIHQQQIAAPPQQLPTSAVFAAPAPADITHQQQCAAPPQQLPTSAYACAPQVQNVHQGNLVNHSVQQSMNNVAVKHGLNMAPSSLSNGVSPLGAIPPPSQGVPSLERQSTPPLQQAQLQQLQQPQPQQPTLHPQAHTFSNGTSHDGMVHAYMSAPALKPEVVEVPPLIDLRGSTTNSLI
mmetsp:Transcript_73043/g.121940  ORF Transcript_73043/g.121940 Transcript_73043/m.121940 type:complete len:1878 (+) Transcript_73043:80-5713(+)